MTRTGIRSAGIIIRGNKILLIHRKKEGDEYWVFPGGGVEDEETPEETVVREIKEELSLKASNPRLAFMYEINGTKHPMFLVDIENGEPVLGGPEAERNSEQDSYAPKWVKIEKLRGLHNLYPESAVEELAKISFLKKFLQ